jgi:hypothetical protein
VACCQSRGRSRRSAITPASEMAAATTAISSIDAEAVGGAAGGSSGTRGEGARAIEFEGAKFEDTAATRRMTSRV